MQHNIISSQYSKCTDDLKVKNKKQTKFLVSCTLISKYNVQLVTGMSVQYLPKKDPKYMNRMVSLCDVE